MISQDELKKIIAQVVREVKGEVQNGKSATKTTSISDSDMVDITLKEMQKFMAVPNPCDSNELMKYKAKTPARIGIWRAGPRYTTETALRFRADHAAAMDAVLTTIDDSFLTEANLLKVSTKCKDKDEYITRPDLGRVLSDDSAKIIKEKCQAKPNVQVFVADGLSSTAIIANIKNILPSLLQGLGKYKLSVGTNFYVNLGRVGVCDHISEIVEPDIVCVLIGERPGLATAESMSAYITYKSFVGIPEAKRTVISNIHKHGTPPVEAGAHVAEVIKKIFDAKASGVDIKL